MKRTVWFWLIAIVITLAAIVFQRQSGPTYPKKIDFNVDTVSATLKLPRSSEVGSQLQITIPALPWEYTAKLHHRPYPSNNDWTVEPPFWPEDDKFVSYLPEVNQKAAKLEYFIEIEHFTSDEVIKLPEEPVVIRYKGSVPAWALIPHIVFIFIALIFSSLSGVMAAFNHDKYKFWAVATLILIFVGGLVFGPIVQKFAFDHFWTGFPFGQDLTDNKTLIMFVVWLMAVLVNWKRSVPMVTVLAAIFTLIIYCIPHSLRGSEFSYESGEIVTGMITYLKTFF
ncbi:MAG TPA: hypothetical protein DG754_01910 [Bacteroidales bacterium]|jgi:hypothetical protein|nr:hypothetical protein [Bacteroidales bacterium]